jgi:hypothetical protein
MVAEYASDTEAADSVLAKYQYRPTPRWEGPTENPLAQLRENATGDAPAIKAFEEPHHFNDGRRMLIRFDQAAGRKYSLYLSRYPDGRGAEKLPGNFTDNSLVNGLRPGVEMYIFLTSTGPDGKESKPSEARKLVTQDHFAEK